MTNIYLRLIPVQKAKNMDYRGFGHFSIFHKNEGSRAKITYRIKPTAVRGLYMTGEEEKRKLIIINLGASFIYILIYTLLYIIFILHTFC